MVYKIIVLMQQKPAKYGFDSHRVPFPLRKGAQIRSSTGRTCRFYMLFIINCVLDDYMYVNNVHCIKIIYHTQSFWKIALQFCPKIYPEPFATRLLKTK